MLDVLKALSWESASLEETGKDTQALIPESLEDKELRSKVWGGVHEEGGTYKVYI